MFDVAGRRAGRVADGHFAAGVQTVEWNGEREDGTQFPTGVYDARLECGGAMKTVKLVRLR